MSLGFEAEYFHAARAQAGGASARAAHVARFPPPPFVRHVEGKIQTLSRMQIPVRGWHFCDEIEFCQRRFIF